MKEYRVVYLDVIEGELNHVDIEIPNKPNPSYLYRLIKNMYPDKINITILSWSLIEY